MHESRGFCISFNKVKSRSADLDLCRASKALNVKAEIMIAKIRLRRRSASAVFTNTRVGPTSILGN